MVEVRSIFGLTAVEDRLIATQGYNYNNKVPSQSVEVFSFQDGWNREPELDMSSTKFGHCSMMMGSWLYTIGGVVDGTSYSYVSNLRGKRGFMSREARTRMSILLSSPLQSFTTQSWISGKK